MIQIKEESLKIWVLIFYLKLVIKVYKKADFSDKTLEVL